MSEQEDIKRYFAKSTTTETTAYEYSLVGGAWQLMKETSISATTQTDGGMENTTTTKTYTRDANGVCTGISQTRTGTSSTVGTSGGIYNYTLQDYSATPAFDAQQGWYISQESYNWKLG